MKRIVLSLCIMSLLLLANTLSATEPETLTKTFDVRRVCTKGAAGCPAGKEVDYFKLRVDYLQVSKVFHFALYEREGTTGEDTFNLTSMHDIQAFKIKMNKYAGGSYQIDEAEINMLFIRINEGINVVENDAPRAGELIVQNCNVKYSPNYKLKDDESLVDEYDKCNKATLKWINGKIDSLNKEIKDYNIKKGATITTIPAVPLAKTLQAYNANLNANVNEIIGAANVPILLRNTKVFTRKEVSNYNKIRLLDQEITTAAGATDADGIYTFLSTSGKGKCKRKELRKDLKRLIRKFYENYEYEMHIQPGSQIKFENGLLDEINLWCKVKGEDEKLFQFTNISPIPFSVVTDFNRLRQPVWKINSADGKYSINLADLLIYKFKSETDSYDKSPADQVIDLNQDKTETILYKEKSFEIIKAAMFTDFIGISDDKPNGLIQTEIWRKINLLSRRYGQNLHSVNTGVFTSVTPLVTFSKIENKNRRIPVSNWTDISTGTLLQKPYVRTVQLAEHANFYSGFSLNLLTLAVPEAKTNIALNAGFGFGLTSLQDSVRALENNEIVAKEPVNFNTNLIQFSGEFTVRFLEDTRFKLWLKQSINYLYSTSDKVTQVQAENKYLNTFDNGGAARFWYLTTELYGNIKFSSATQVFVRARFNNQVGNINSNFFQAQFGFAFDIMGGNFFTKK